MKKVIFFCVLSSCLIGVYYCSLAMDKKHPIKIVEDMLYLPSGEFLKGAALGYDDMLGDILWIETLTYFGGHAVTDQDFSWLYHMLDIVTTLTPFFQYPYEFGGIVLATELGDIDKSTRLLKKGMTRVDPAHPRYWYFPFFIAFNHMYYENDYKTAAHYLEQAAKFPKSPEYIPLLVSRLYANADSPEIAVTFLKEMINSTDKPELKNRLIQRLNELINANNMKFLDQAVNQFFSTFDRYPKDLEELKEKEILSFMPVDPRGGEYYISKEDHSVQNTKKAEDLKVHVKQKKTILNMVPAE